ncbi:MAG TPA: major facilitator superfamily domain-containing protein 7 [Anaerolineae bacterium]|nr:major facilitator superfamily domain-containing protein 7 [Anaerolineae bacterium]
MEQSSYKLYGYRWVMILVFMLIILINQMLWISFAPVTSEAVAHFGVSELEIGLLSMSFMIVYIVVSFPASWVIDTFGIRVGVGIGAVLTGVFGVMRGLVTPDYNLVLIAQIGIGIGQPFILNAMTTVAARWFRAEDRATMTGMGSLSMYLGIILGMVITPFLVGQTGIDAMLLIYGIVAVIVAAAFLVLARERPPTAPCPPEMEERSLMLDGLKQTLRKRDFILMLVIFFVGLGAFNAVTTWIEEILSPRGFSMEEAGITGGLMVAAGVVGAVVMPLLSDRFRKRVPFIILALVGTIPGLIGIAFAPSYSLLLLSAFVLGFFLLSAGPIGFQYGAEIAYPAPEGTSNGLLLMIGQISGILFILGMDSFRSPSDGSMTLSLVVIIGLLALCLLIAFLLKEPKVITTDPSS